MDRIQKHKEICNKLNEIYEKKNHDYGNSFGDTYAKLGIISAVTRISDKTNRLMSLCTKEQKVKDESIDDTLMDLANYAIMTLIERSPDVGRTITICNIDNLSNSNILSARGTENE